MVAVVSPELMPHGAPGRKSQSYGGRARPVTGSMETAVLPARSRPSSLPVRRPVRLPASTYRRRRAVAAGLVFVLVLALSAALGTLGGGPLPVPERPAHVDRAVHVVQPGDTFWSIARRLEPTGDPRPLVDRMIAAHGSTTLHVGERLPLPSSG